MTRRFPYSVEYKLDVIHHFLSGNGHESTAYFFKITPSLVRKWVKMYQQHGVDGLQSKPATTSYSFEYKAEVVSYILKTGASLLDTKAHFNGPSDTTILRWKNIYQKEGLLALQPRKISADKKMNPPKKLESETTKDKTTEELQAELLYLRAENAVLKKYLALEDKKKPIKKKRK